MWGEGAESSSSSHLQVQSCACDILAVHEAILEIELVFDVSEQIYYLILVKFE